MASRIVTALLVLVYIAASLQPGRCLVILNIYANDKKLNSDTENSGTVSITRGTEVNLACGYQQQDVKNNHGIEPIFTDEHHNSLNVIVDKHLTSTWFLNYTISPGRAAGTYRYICEYEGVRTVEVTVSIGVPTTQPTTQPPTSKPTTRPAAGGGGGGGTDKPKFTGLNPLIYTVSAVILLGTLAIVAIITCWVRARRSYNSRMLRSNSAPQDYLDYISDNEFTPMTSSEFLASLQQRPPNYDESAELESQMRRGGQEDGNGSEGNQEGTPQGESLSTFAARIQRRRRRNRRSLDPEREEENRTREQSVTDSSNDTHEQQSTSPATLADTHTTDASPTGAGNSREGDTGDRESQITTGTLIEVDIEPVAISAPTEQQIIEIEAAVGAVNERMSRIRERDRELTQRVEEEEDEDLLASESSSLLTADRSLLDA